MELPNRKRQRLSGYDYTTPNYYFVTICTQEKKHILWNKPPTHSPDYVGADAHIGPRHQLSSYGSCVDKYIKTIPGIDKYVVMPNHIHMIIAISSDTDGPMWASAPTQSLSQLIKSFKILVTKELGQRIFQRSFHDHIIRCEDDYLRIWEYVDTNPLTWKSDCFYTEE